MMFRSVALVICLLSTVTLVPVAGAQVILEPGTLLFDDDTPFTSHLAIDSARLATDLCSGDVGSMPTGGRDCRLENDERVILIEPGPVSFGLELVQAKTLPPKKPGEIEVGPLYMSFVGETLVSTGCGDWMIELTLASEGEQPTSKLSILPPNSSGSKHFVGTLKVEAELRYSNLATGVQLFEPYPMQFEFGGRWAIDPGYAGPGGPEISFDTDGDGVPDVTLPPLSNLLLQATVDPVTGGVDPHPGCIEEINGQCCIFCMKPQDGANAPSQ